MANGKWTTGLGLLVIVVATVFVFALITGSHFEWQSRNGKTHIDIQIGTGDSTIGTGSVIVLVLAVAFLTASVTRSTPDNQKSASRSGVLRDLAQSETDCWIGGVCGGLGAHTLLPSWLWRLAFTLLFFAYGTGLLAYLALLVFMPASKSDSIKAAAPSDPNVVNS